MKNQIFLIVFIFLCSNIGLGQTKKIDTTKIWNKIKETEAIEFSEPIKALKKYEEIYNLSTSIDFDKGAFKAVLYSAYLHNNLAQYDSAFFFFNKAKTINLRLKEPINDAYIALNRANTYMYQGDLESSIENHFYGIEILEKEKDSARLIGAYANLSIVFDQLDDFDKEIEYLKKSLNLTPKDGWQDMALTYGDIGLAYIDKKNYEKAYVNLSKADSISQFTKSSMLDFYVTRNWGDYYISIENFKTAIGYLKTSILKAKENNYKFYEKELMINLGECYVKIGNLELAEPILIDALNEGKELAVLEIPKKASILLSKLYEKMKNYKNANLYLNQHLLFKDSLVSQEHIKTVNNLDLKYQTEKKDKELAEQKLELADQELALKESKSKTRTMNILIVSLLLGSILLWFSFRQRQKRMQHQLVAIEREQELKTLESLMEGEEKERFRIAKELHDGVNGDLAAIKFKLTSLLETNNQVINEAVTMIDNSCEQVRAISHNLLPPSLKDFNLLEAVEEYCQSMNSIHEPSIEFQQLGNPIELDKKQEANVFRIVQELVTNSIKHAEAKEINVQLSHLNNTLQLTVEDNGEGFDPKTVKSDGIGMQNVQSRVDYLNATMDFLSNEKGTSYTIAMDTKTATSC